MRKQLEKLDCQTVMLHAALHACKGHYIPPGRKPYTRRKKSAKAMLQRVDRAASAAGAQPTATAKWQQPRLLPQ